MRGRLLFLAACALALTGCAAGADAAGPAADAGPDIRLTVFAAASLQGAFDEIADLFEDGHPGVAVDAVRYDGSATLATQLIEGAAADVFASADEANMQKVVDAGLAASPTVFATNTLTLIVPAGNPAGVSGLSDFARPDPVIVQCAHEVPCGAAADRLLTAAGVTARVDSYEQNVTAVLTKVAAGEADAGLVYVTDAAGRSDIDTVTTPGAEAVVNLYPIAALAGASAPEAATAFVAFVRGPVGQRVLGEHGFGTR
ncbi:molybdate ABC transporter substrate-binding protein [uncultured Microbacterium sp.]|uniref:Molybdate-binding protein n=1 Tax=uncultured Microbacterium sp. TaxID=191216 RepID=A0A1Y5P8K2_9MICO|nr:molybdate ABC transporter substrate-binding protein [uncultured Microbacterium sp.]SBS75013.1 Molybdate-binding protein [uncultured Microbacterium sp.]